MKWRLIVLRVLDVILPPFVYLSGWVFRHLRRVGVSKFPHCKGALLRAGVFPVRNHYYEPQFDFRETKQPFSAVRPLPGIDWNIAEQLETLDSFHFVHECGELLKKEIGELEFSINNILFGPGDAEYWYQLIRTIKPLRIFEIGSGNSTLVAMKAVGKNREENPGYSCRHLCIEPFERPWLEKTGLPIIRKKVEDIGAGLFAELQVNDMLFIDSSHVIRPQGDVLFEYLELLPLLRKGVIVQIHDIFSPRNYPKHFLSDTVRFWNEQYLLEAFLTQNRNWKIIGAINYLCHDHYERLKSVAPSLLPESEPSSIYIQRIS
jgi:hypothetical protein